MRATATRDNDRASRETITKQPMSMLGNDFCDACHGPGLPHVSHAYVLVQLPSGRLALCYHHANLYQGKIEDLGGVLLVDERYQLLGHTTKA